MGDLSPGDADGFWDLCHDADIDAESLDQAWCRIQQLLLRRRGPDQLGYLAAISRYRDERLEPGLPRHHLCGNRMYRVTVEVIPLADYQRDLCHCERCGLLADVPAGAPAPLLVAAGQWLTVHGNPWPTAWMTAGISPMGFSLLEASSPRRLEQTDLIEWPQEFGGRRFGIVLVTDGDHIIVQTPLPPFESVDKPLS